MVVAEEDEEEEDGGLVAEGSSFFVEESLEADESPAPSVWVVAFGSASSGREAEELLSAGGTEPLSAVALSSLVFLLGRGGFLEGGSEGVLRAKDCEGSPLMVLGHGIARETSLHGKLSKARMATSCLGFPLLTFGLSYLQI